MYCYIIANTYSALLVKYYLLYSILPYKQTLERDRTPYLRVSEILPYNNDLQ